MAVGLGDRAGYPLSFVRFAAFGIPITVVSLGIASGYMLLRHFS